jgi:hypothetical protein
VVTGLEPVARVDSTEVSVGVWIGRRGDVLPGQLQEGLQQSQYLVVFPVPDTREKLTETWLRN